MKKIKLAVGKFALVDDDVPPGMVADHKDLNKLNNQRSNLRICYHSQNMANRAPYPHSSKYKGVRVHRNSKNKPIGYICAIKVKGIITTEFFPYTPEGEKAAARCYNELAKEHFGEFARGNNVD